MSCRELNSLVNFPSILPELAGVFKRRSHQQPDAGGRVSGKCADTHIEALGWAIADAAIGGQQPQLGPRDERIPSFDYERRVFTRFVAVSARSPDLSKIMFGFSNTERPQDCRFRDHKPLRGRRSTGGEMDGTCSCGAAIRLCAMNCLHED